MKMNKILYSTLAVLILIFAGCAKFEEFKSTDLASAPTVTVNTEEIQDSSVIVSFSSTSTGFLSFVLIDGVGNPTPDSSALIQLNVEALLSGSYQVEAAGEKIMHEFTGLEQNKVYEVFAVAQNDDGVLSNVSDALMIKTTDNYAPVISSVTPDISNEPVNAIGFEVTITFDEPISETDASKFIFTYAYEDVQKEADSAVVVADDPYSVTVYQSHEANPGDYVFLTIEEGAVLDIVKNKIAGVFSGIDEDEYLAGLYFRLSKENWNFEIENTVPENLSATSDIDFNVTLQSPVPVESNAEDGSIRFIVKSTGITQIYDVPAANIEVDENGTDITIVKPFSATYGQTVYLEIDAATFTDDFGNGNAAIESGVDDINPDELEITEVSWFMSYGYTIDLITKTYQVDGISYFEGSDDSFTVTIEVDPENENQVLVTGIFGSEVAVPATFDGDFGTLTFNFPLQDDGYYWIDLGDINDYGDGSTSSFEEAQGLDHFTCHITEDGNMFTTGEYLWGSYSYAVDDENAGWNNIFVSSTWTKAEPVEAAMQKSIKVNSIHKHPRRF